MRTPTSTYRLQITESFDLLDAARTLGYLHELGVDWVYVSPLLSSESGSEHGYDVADHRAIDPSRGRASGLSALATEAQRFGMGVLVDIVPNHVGVARPWENEWWWHVLTHGQESQYAGAFDIDWEAGGGRLRIPVIGDDDLLPDGRIDNLRVLAGELHYHDNRFPLAPGTVHDPGEDANHVHARQHYELVSWRDADHDLNYRRFFAVNTLVAIRVEDHEWFERSHAEIRRWFDEGLVDGLRVDHPDGLRDPGKYLDDLAELTKGSYVLVEKILEPGEVLPRTWATAGTTGYDAMATVDRLFVDPAGEEPLDALEARLRGAAVDWHAMTHGTKREVADGILHSEVRRITRELLAVLEEAPEAVEPVGTTSPEDVASTGSTTEAISPTFEQVEDAVAELLACFPVYRSYLPEGREHLEQALAAAREHRPDLAGVLDVLAPVLSDGAAAPTQRFQQTSGMVMAKGVEDCAFYRWSRLTSLNEVGGDPSVFSVAPEEFHQAMAVRQSDWPHAMTATSTHDTKRGEDVRARITVLAELPELWASTLERLLELVPVPDPGFASLLWQAVLGAWPSGGHETDPAFRDRLHAYAEKAMREAGDRTLWTAPDEEYERAMQAVVDAVLDRPEVRAVFDELLEAADEAGWSNAISSKLVSLTIPGVPDVYQGSELWEQSLVDPDNRRPVDFDRRAALLKELRAGERPTLAEAGADGGSLKLLLTHVALTARRDRPDLFTSYAPLTADGSAADHVVAFDRGGAITVATRLPVGLRRKGGWGDTTVPLPPGLWTELLTGRRFRADEHGRLALAELLTTYPAALLVRDDRRGGRGRFDVWAPLPKSLSLQVGDRVVPMAKGDDDWWSPVGPDPIGEVDYGYRVDGAETPVPDPRSRRQPAGVHGLSRTFDPGVHHWSDEGWAGRQLAGSVVYELHVGTFTPEGTLDAAATRLEHLRSIGVDLVEVLPVNAFNGEHGWGYDGVLWHAVHEQYGGPAAYQRFVDACHAAGLGVVQDVVYNHFGPSGNYLPMFGPYLSSEGANPWGDHVNLDGEGSDEVRAYVLENVRMWFEDYHVDALRLDAVHALEDSSPTHLLEEMAVLTQRLSAHLGRPLTLIAESDMNDTRIVTPREGGGYGVDAQWSDDFHHALHVQLTGETDGYYADFEPLSALAKVCEKGFFHDGTWSSFRESEHGRPVDVDRMPGWRLVVCSQNHDQVGNRARGDRITEKLDDDQLACAALLTLAGPFTPMLFQGEEWAASTPFAFFTSHPEPELGAAVTEGRTKEFAKMGWDLASVPDPQDARTFAMSKLDWSEPEGGRHAVVLSVYRSLADLRRRLPELTDPDLRTTSCEYDEDARWFVLRRGRVAVVVNFGSSSVTVDLGADHEVLWTTPAGATAVRRGVELPPHAGAVLVPLP
ncbi:malto-oligosyltrehalose synthase [Nocardioides caldifontis]|uniref:malto-oligosyltrehalose synthase n=1 Tax=Nocardioides caldifontis TaxID=2588938 RepID=UPI001EEFC015|nr:malto-oligosyltrehalose synthase [Nocardioides caldifontis]